MSDTILITPCTRVRVQEPTPGALRITHAPPGDGAFPDDPAWLPDLLVGRTTDAQTLAYQRGEAAATTIDVTPRGGEPDVRISPPSGSFPALARQRRWTLVRHRTIPKGEAWSGPAGGTSKAERPETEARTTLAFPSADGILLHIPGITPGGAAHAHHPD